MLPVLEAAAQSSSGKTTAAPDPPFCIVVGHDRLVNNGAYNEHFFDSGRSAWVVLSGGQVEGLVEAERHALGVGPLEQFLAQVGAQLVEAVLAVAGFEILPGCPVGPRKACATPWSTAARCQSPASAARHARPRLA